MTYDTMLIFGAQAIGAGSATDAPSVDILEVPRKTPYAAGAYSYPR